VSFLLTRPDAPAGRGRKVTPPPAKRVAERLGIHEQTARYRIARLRELFGAALDDPDERFWLELALRVPSEVSRSGG
jgi:methionyl-tRNA formyltransferase